ncbi:hypothetical protein [Clostridium sp.]|uniref:hypothetical protein n=1 Tax=Clostridium sp. TaxID=1506 RepID=UPI00262658E7|nr:hypothetical protein [Clostridium sp.]
MEENFTKIVITNLQSEAEQLNIALKKTREDGNWGTYKNIVQAYERILSLLNEYKVKPIEVIKLEDEIFSEYYGDRDTNKIIELIKQEYNIQDVNDLSPEQEYKMLKLLEKSVFKILKNEVNKKYSTLKCNDIVKYGENEIDFTINPSYDLTASKQDFSRIQCFYGKQLNVGFETYKIKLDRNLSDVLDDNLNIFMFISKIIDAYLNKIDAMKKEALKHIGNLEKNDICFGIGLGNKISIKISKDNYRLCLEINYKLNIGVLNSKVELIN